MKWLSSLVLITLLGTTAIAGCSLAATTPRSVTEITVPSDPTLTSTNTYIDYMEIECYPERDYFAAYPHRVMEGELEKVIKEKPFLTALQGKHYGIFVNGKYITELAATQQCKLDKVRVETVIDYSIVAYTQHSIPQKDLPEMYQELTKEASEGAEYSIKSSTDIHIWDESKLIAAFDHLHSYARQFENIKLDQEILSIQLKEGKRDIFRKYPIPAIKKRPLNWKMHSYPTS